MSTALITGCDYGIEFEFARQYAAAGWRVHAVCLDESSREKMDDLPGDTQFHRQDVADRAGLATLNMAVKSLSLDFAAQGVITAVLHPGSVATETRKGGQFPVSESVSGMRNVIEGLTAEMSGTFQRYDGGAIEW